MTENNNKTPYSEQIEAPTTDHESTAENDDFNPYQTSKTSFEENILHKASLKSLTIRFCVIYLLTYVCFIAIMIFLLIITNGALGMLVMWMLIFSFIGVPYITYLRCLQKIPQDASLSLRSQFKAISVVLAIALPFVVSFLFFGLCAVIYNGLGY